PKCLFSQNGSAPRNPSRQYTPVEDRNRTQLLVGESLSRNSATWSLIQWMMRKFARPGLTRCRDDASETGRNPATCRTNAMVWRGGAATGLLLRPLSYRS